MALEKQSSATRMALAAFYMVGIILAAAPTTNGQCSFGWKSGTGLPESGTVHALTVWDDGNESALYAGGRFNTADGITVNNIARWDGTSWSALSTGASCGVGTLCVTKVYALTVYNGNLIAGGNFIIAGGTTANFIAQWNGTSWSTLGTGMNGIVYALAVFNGNLIAGGDFTSAAGTSANRIAQWNGTSWSALGAGMNGGVDALTNYNGNLIAGGFFTTAGGPSANRIAQWNGTSWSALGTGTNQAVFALTVYKGNLIAGGAFTAAGGTSANYIAQWNPDAPGEWAALDTGMGDPGTAGTLPVHALTVYNSALIAGGGFVTAGSNSANYIAEWNGTSWSALGTGMGGGFFGSTVYALTVYDSHLIAGGDFTTAGGNNSAHWARWGLVDTGEPDEDGDSIPDACDNCTILGNPNQEDTDCDGIGDACDLCTDTDVDDFGNPGFAANTCLVDNCPSATNSDQADGDGDGVGDTCDDCLNTIPGISVDAQGCPIAIPGDMDRDGDVDMSDFGQFQNCLSGAGASQTDSACDRALIDNDTDVDSTDFAGFTKCLSGANVPVSPSCAD